MLTDEIVYGACPFLFIRKKAFEPLPDGGYGERSKVLRRKCVSSWLNLEWVFINHGAKLLSSFGHALFYDCLVMVTECFVVVYLFTQSVVLFVFCTLPWLW